MFNLNQIIKEGLESLKNIKKDKAEYKAYLERIKALPEEYSFVYEKACHYMWSQCSGDGYDMLKLQYSLIELFEKSAAHGKQVSEVTGEDVAGFCDELLKNAKTYIEGQRQKLNSDILKKLKKE